MADPALVKRNMQKMLEQGATPAEIEEYARLEGVTPEQVNPRTPLQQVGDWVSRTDQELTNFQKGVRQTVVGKQDPRYKDLPTFPATEKGASVLDIPVRGVNDAALLTDTDEDYGAIIKSNLEKAGRLIGTEKDANGYEIVTYRGDDGNEYVAYINKPGLDMTDINRELTAAIPAAITGFGISSLAKKAGMGLFGRTATVGTGEAATAGGRDVTAAHQGAKFDPVNTALKMVLAGGGGALFEGLSGPITRGWRRIFSSKVPPVDASGNLTVAGRQAALAAGLDPEDMNARLAEALQGKLVNAADPREAGVAVRTGEFGIPTTKGQRTKDPVQLGREKDLSRGVYGPEARELMGGKDPPGFYKQQESAIDRAVNESVGMSIAPRQGGKEPTTLGSRIRTGVTQAQDDFRRMDSSLWDETGPLYPKPEAFDTLPDILTDSLSASGVRPDPSLPAANRAMKILDEFMTGDMTLPPYRVLGESKKAPPKPTIRDIQKRLLQEYMGAELGSTDARAAKAVYDGYNDWIEDLAERGAIAGDVEGAAKLWVARAFHREMKGLFSPDTPAGKTLEAVLDKNRTPETVVDALVGRGGPTSAPSSHSVQALKHLDRILGPAGRDTWDDIRLAYWVKITQGKDGTTLTPRMLKKNIDAAIRNQGSVMTTLYDESEIKTMRRLSKALDDVISVDPNPSGTAHELARMTREGGARGLTKTALQTQSKRELFSKHNVLMSRIYGLLAKKLTVDPIGARTGMGASVARRATSQELTPKPGSSLVAPAGSIGALEFANDIYPEEVE